MFERITPPQPDPIIRLMTMYSQDTRPDRIDLGVGVYRDAQGRTPVMRAVKAAEARILETQDSKGYLGLAGDPAYLAAMETLLLGGAVDSGRVAALGTVGGTSAIRQALELVRMARPEAAVWISRPSWPNHAAIIDSMGLARREYRYFDPVTCEADVPAMLADLAGARPGDVVLLHGCCHNPSGADLSPENWAEIAKVLEKRELLPFVDIAYQGFGDGLDADAGGLRHLAARLPEMLIAASCSKNFGLYRDRVGITLALCDTPDLTGRTAAVLAAINRQSIAFPPDHGARVVTTILGDEGLRADWRDELATMRQRIIANRAALAKALRAETNSDRFDFLTGHRGMFSLLGMTPEQVAQLRERHGVYLVDGSRMNLAGLDGGNIPIVARAIAQAAG